MANVALTERALQQQQPRQVPAGSRGSLSDPRRAPMSTFTPAVKGRDNYNDMVTIDMMVRFGFVVQTPGSGNALHVVNKAPVEFPMHASVVEYEYSDIDPYAQDGVQIETKKMTEKVP